MGLTVRIVVGGTTVGFVDEAVEKEEEVEKVDEVDALLDLLSSKDWVGWRLKEDMGADIGAAIGVCIGAKAGIWDAAIGAKAGGADWGFAGRGAAAAGAWGGVQEVSLVTLL